MKYLVMETAQSYAVLLDEQGRFVKSANLGYEIGDTVTEPILMRDTPLEKVNGRSKIVTRVVATIGAIAAIILIVFGLNRYQERMNPYTSIFMTINPEVEIVLNKAGDVIQITGQNEDGRLLIVDYEQQSKNKNVVANDLVDRAMELGYLAEGGQVALAIDTPDKDLFRQYVSELRRELAGRSNITVIITDMDNRNRVPDERPEPEVKPEIPAEPTEDSGYDESSYEAPVVEEPAEPEPPAVQEEPAPTPKPETTQKPAPTPRPEPKPEPSPQPQENTKPTPPSNEPDNKQPDKNQTDKPDKNNNDDSDYDDSDYSDYDDTDYDDSDYSDYYDNRSDKRNRDRHSKKKNHRDKKGYTNERNSRNRR